MVDKKEIRKLDEQRNEAFFKTLDWFIEVRKTSRSRLAINCGLDCTCLNVSKTVGNRWPKVGTFLKICDALEITPSHFFNQMEFLTETNERDE